MGSHGKGKERIAMRIILTPIGKYEVEEVYEDVGDVEFIPSDADPEILDVYILNEMGQWVIRQVKETATIRIQ